MIDKPRVVQTASHPTAIIRPTIPQTEIRNITRPGCRELTAAVAARGIATAGPWFAHHLRMDVATFGFEIGADAP